MVCGVYTVIGLGNRYYVGSSVDIHARWKQHVIELRLGRHKNKEWQRDWNAFGPDAFTWRVHSVVSPELRVVTEKELIQRLRKSGNVLYNC